MIQIFSTFEHSMYLELAITALEKYGIRKERILVVPLANRKEERNLFDTLHRADGVSLIDIGMAMATGFSVIGASIGFILSWGPIYWGLIGAASGFVLGFCIKLFYLKTVDKKKQLLKGEHAEVILVVDCDDAMAERVEDCLWDHLAIGVARSPI